MTAASKSAGRGKGGLGQSRSRGETGRARVGKKKDKLVDKKECPLGKKKEEGCEGGENFLVKGERALAERKKKRKRGDRTIPKERGGLSCFFSKHRGRPS